MVSMEGFYRHVMENYPEKVVSDVYETELNSTSSFAPSPLGFTIKFNFIHETDFSFHFLNRNSNYKRQFVSSAKLPKQWSSATFNDAATNGTVRKVMLQKLKTSMMAPSLHQQMIEMAMNAAHGYLKSKPPDHNSIVIDLFARVSLRFDFEEAMMPLFDVPWCGVFKKHTVSHEVVDSKTCSICQDDFSDQSVSVSAPCGHKFHRDCINRWLAVCRSVKSRLCPNCRKCINKAKLEL